MAEFAKLRAQWDADPYAIHKRPPFIVHSFDRTDRFWVGGSTFVSVIGSGFDSEEEAQAIAEQLNAQDAEKEIASQR